MDSDNHRKMSCDQENQDQSNPNQKRHYQPPFIISDQDDSTKSSYKESAKGLLKAFCEKSKKASKWIWDDLRKPHLLWVKIIFLFQSASLVVLYPYLTIHMRSLGFSIEDTAVVNSAVPAADIIGTVNCFVRGG